MYCVLPESIALRAAHAAIDRTFRLMSEAGSTLAIESEVSKVAVVASLVGAQKVVELEAMLAQKVAPVKSPQVKKSTRSLVKSSRNGKNGFQNA